MGRAALDVADSEGHFGITAEVHSVLKPPHSCLIDGIQLGSGCTLGKRNITVHETDGPAYALFTKSDGMKIRVSLRHGIPAMVTRLVDGSGVESAGRRFLEMAPEELFEITIVTAAGEPPRN
jgi:formylmethanofuran dehydrogenase subunit E